MNSHKMIGKGVCFLLCAAGVIGLSADRSTKAYAQSSSVISSLEVVKSSADSNQNDSGTITVTLQDALARAQKNDVPFLTALANAKLAREDRLQARDALLPSVGVRSEYLNTQGNGVLPGGRYVTNDGVHVYREWSAFHQDLSPAVFAKTGLKRTVAAEAIAKANAEIARRGLVVTVTKTYYALVVAERKYSSAQQAADQSQRFLRTSQDLETGGEVAHSDVVKFQIQNEAQDRAFQDAELVMENARLELTVLLFRDFNQNFQVVDDLQFSPAVPPLEEIETIAKTKNPDLRIALESVRTAKLDVSTAKQAFLPTFTVDVDYGIEANAIALRSQVAADRGAGNLPNLGYFLTATATLPIWDWGSRRSKVRQAQIRRDLSDAELSATQRQLLKSLYAYYQELQVARKQVESLRRSAGLAGESLRLNTLRYDAGETTVLDVVDAQNTLVQSQNAYADAQMRYSVSIAALQTLTGSF